MASIHEHWRPNKKLKGLESYLTGKFVQVTQGS